MNSNIEVFSSSYRHGDRRVTALLMVFMGLLAGCFQSEPIVPYEIPTQIPAALQAERDRMLAAIVPQGEQAWFFKVTGPESAIGSLEPDFRRFVEEIKFQKDEPVLDSLPSGWRRGGEKPMRFATLDINLNEKQLNISVSKLALQEDWDQQVKMNVNRWRGQLGLPASDAKWADAEELEVAIAESPSVWVDLVAAVAAENTSESPVIGDPGLSGGIMSPARTTEREATPEGDSAAADPRLQYDRPDGWRDGRISSMRMAAFQVGPEDASAELTVISAGGDLRGNVARWLGQVREGEVPAEVVDQTLADAQEIDVDGRPGQRFLISGENNSSGTVIDATIVPLDEGFSLFIKMTGPAKTVSQQSDAIAAFLKSLKLNL